MPDEVPVMTITLPSSLPSIPSSLTTCNAVGRESPGPSGLA
jgi:hypothetical protein